MEDYVSGGATRRTRRRINALFGHWSGGRSRNMPADYRLPQHVDVAVIADWLLPGRGRTPITSFICGIRR